jgi:heme/copper-type cytochrome/quinol oxidase subunit 2
MGEKSSILKTGFPIYAIFIFLALGMGFLHQQILRWGGDYLVLQLGNTLIFLVTFIAFYLHVKAVRHQNTSNFVTGVYGGMMVKMFVTLIAALIYIVSADGKVNKPALFGCMFFYFLYTVVETRLVTKMNNHAKKG